jgi:hypothetical protein
MAMLRIGVNVIPLTSYGNDVNKIIGLLTWTKSQGIVVCTSSDDSYNTLLVEGLKKVFESSQVVWINGEHAGISQEGYHHYNALLKSGQQLDVTLTTF